MTAGFQLRCSENGKGAGGTAEVKQATAAGRGMLGMAITGMEEVAKFIVASTKVRGGGEALEAPHATRAAFTLR